MLKWRRCIFQGTWQRFFLLIPMHISLKEVFKEAIDECNKYGDFLNDDFIVTNVKTLSFEEIKDFLENQKDRELAVFLTQIFKFHVGEILFIFNTFMDDCQSPCSFRLSSLNLQVLWVEDLLHG